MKEDSYKDEGEQRRLPPLNMNKMSLIQAALSELWGCAGKVGELVCYNNTGAGNKPVP